MASSSVFVRFVQGELILHLVLLLSKVLEATGAVINKAVLSSEINVVYFSFLYCLAASIALLPAAYFLESKKRMPFSKDVILPLFLAGTCGFFASNLLFLYGMKSTSAVLSTVISCTIPIQASVIAIITRVEKVNLYRYDGQAKLLGIFVAFCGTVVMSLYRGPTLLKHGISPDISWYLGALMTTLGATGLAVSLNLQAPLLRKYQAPATALTGCAVTGTILLGITCIITLESWSLPSRNVILAILYDGWFGIALSFSLTGWVISKTGLLLVCCYTAVNPITTTVLSFIFLASSIYFGSIVGTFLVVLGVILCGWSEAETKKLACPNLEDALIIT